MSHPQLNGMSFVTIAGSMAAQSLCNHLLQLSHFCSLQCFDIWMHGSAEEIKYNYI